jgi:hypothetical protein
MAITLSGTGGITFNNSTVQASAGQVLQVVQGTYSTETSTTTATYTDTGLTATITPKFSTSKILVLVSQNIRITSTLDAGGSINVVRNSTVIFNPSDSLQNYTYAGSSASLEMRLNVCINYLDSPATTSAVTYKTQQSGFSGKAMTSQKSTNPSTITLMEIAG